MSDDNDNQSNQSSNSNDNYQQMPDEPPAAIIVAVPDLSPPATPSPDFQIDDPGYRAPSPSERIARMPGADTPGDTIGPHGSMPPPESSSGASSGLSDLGLATTQDDTGTDPMQPIAPPPTPPEQQNPPTPGGLTDPTLYTPAPAGAPAPTEPWHTPSGAPMDEGFYVWLSHHGVTPGDPAQAYRLDEFKSNYLSLPQSDHNAYIETGRADPANHRFNLTAWSTIPGLPPPNPGSTMDHLPPLGDDQAGGPPPPRMGPPAPPEEPGPVLEGGTGGTSSGLSDLGLATTSTAAPARSTQYDWQGQRLGRWTWDPQQGRYV